MAEDVMACIVGITKDPDASRRHWERQYRNVRAWRIILGPVPRNQARHSARHLTRQYRCASSPSGDTPIRHGTMWYVYYFEHDGKK